MENEVKQTKKKSGALFTLFACVMTGVIVYFAVTIGQELGKNAEGTNGSNSSGSVSKEETKIDDDTKKAVNDTLSALFVNAEYKNGNYRSAFIIDYGTDIFDGSINSDDSIKTAIILHSGKGLQWNKYTAKNGKFIKNNPTTFDPENLMYVNTDQVSAQYKKVFGTELKEFKFVPGCPSYDYDSVNKVYVEFLGCGSAQYYGQLIYPEKYTQDGNTVTITAYVGGYKSNPDSETNSENSYYLYSDYNSADETKKLQNLKSINDFKIDDSNKDKFTKYNIVFEKASDGSYYYKSVSKA